MKTKLIILLFLLFFSSNIAISQNDESWKIYDDSEVAIIKITMDENDLQFMYDNPERDSMHVSQVHFNNAFIDEFIDSVGIRIRGNTSRSSHKKSIKLSFNTFIKGRKFYSLEKLNLNGEHNDPSIVRSKLCWDFYNGIGMVSTRATHAAVYINDKYYGLYISIEHIDEEFLQKNYADDSGNLWKCLFGSDLVALGNDPELYKFVNGDGERPYSLISNEEVDDYTQLSRLINLINDTSENFEDSLESILDVNSVIKYLATNVMVGGWDDYWSLSNNYYLYHNPTLDKFNLIPYDYDNTFGVAWWSHIDWETVDPYSFGKIFPGPRPLAEKIMISPKYRNLYSHFLEFYSNNIFNTTEYFDRLIQLRTKIQAFAEQDTFKSKDWGISNQDFLRSFDQSDFSYQNGDYIVPNSIKGFIQNRATSLSTQINYMDYPPIIYDLRVSSKMLQSDETLEIRTSVFSHKNLISVKAELTIDGGQPEIFDFIYNPVINSYLIEETDRWTINLPAFKNSQKIILSVIAEDKLGGVTSYPENGIVINIAGDITKEVILNELMSSNTSTIKDLAEEYDDWLEIYNPQDTIVNLSGKYLTDKEDNLTKWQFPENAKIQPHQYILIWCDEDQDQVGAHTNFKISSRGEFIAIVDNDGVTIVDSVTIPQLNENESYARRNDEGDWLITETSTPGESNFVTSVDDNNINQYNFKLDAYPNPFNPSTIIEYEIANPMSVELRIFDVLGREIWSISKERKEYGKYSLQWNGNDKEGRVLASGIYLLNINGESYSKTIKLMLLR
jgi:CotH kinase protein/Lamin Tail Domain/FlgD Ig-like domain